MYFLTQPFTVKCLSDVLQNETTMKKLFLLLTIALGPISSEAQTFPNVQRSMLTKDGPYTCVPCYTWGVPMIDTFKASYGDRLIAFSKEQAPYGSNPLGTYLSGYYGLTSYLYFLDYTINSPSMYVNHYFISHDNGDSAFIAAARHRIDSTNAQAPIASPIFSVIKRGPDSMIIVTKTKFLQTTTGDYRIAVLLLQDSIYYDQWGSSTGYIYHMHQLTGPDFTSTTWATGTWDGDDSLCYTMANGPIPANTIFTDTFRIVLRPTQVPKDMYPVAVVWQNDTVRLYHDSTYTTSQIWNKYLYVNANEEEGFGPPTSAPQENGHVYTATVFPNPAINTISVKLEGIADKVTLQILSVTGQVEIEADVMDKQFVDISRLSTGQYIYLFKVKGNTIANGVLSKQ